MTPQEEEEKKEQVTFRLPEAEGEKALGAGHTPASLSNACVQATDLSQDPGARKVKAGLIHPPHRRPWWSGRDPLSGGGAGITALPTKL